MKWKGKAVTHCDLVFCEVCPTWTARPLDGLGDSRDCQVHEVAGLKRWRPGTCTPCGLRWVFLGVAWKRAERKACAASFLCGWRNSAGDSAGYVPGRSESLFGPWSFQNRKAEAAKGRANSRFQHWVYYACETQGIFEYFWTSVFEKDQASSWNIKQTLDTLFEVL